MNFILLYQTLSHLRTRQVLYQLKYRLVKKKYRDLYCPNEVQCSVLTSFIPKNKSCSDQVFSFLNLSSSFSSWNDTSNGMLWAYNLNYMDWLLQEGMPYEEGAKWIEKFIDELPQNRIGLDPYPIALRGINWIKFISLYKERIDEKRMKRWNDSLYSQYKLLEKKLEYHLLGNHLLEDAYSLYIASIYFKDASMYRKASMLLIKELKEQTLMDGAHYEQSPMYHCILLDRLLDCYNISFNNLRFENQSKDVTTLKNYCGCMLGHLESMLYKDGTYPLFNDSAMGIAPTPTQLFDYASKLGLQWNPVPLEDSGYRKMVNPVMEAFVDVGNITAAYQPGHTHADTFSYELKIDGEPLVVDTGISTYNKTTRRQEERGTSAHNTVTVSGRNSSEVWGGFRVGKRAKVKILKDEKNQIKASHDGFSQWGIHTRSFQMDTDTFCIIDEVNSNHEAQSYIHLAPEVKVVSYTNQRIVTSIAVINLEGADKVELRKDKISSEYNSFKQSMTVKVSFKNRLTYRIAKL